MLHRVRRVWPGVVGLVLLLAVSGCTEDKALALQSAAIQYRDQAVRALTLTAQGIRAATAMPARTPDQLADQLKSLDRPLDATILDQLLKGEAELAQSGAIATQPLDALRNQVDAFSSIFDNLPRGSYLAQDEVKRAVPIALRLNQSLLNVAAQIEAGTVRIADNPRRIEIIEDTNAALALSPGDKRDKALLRAAQGISELSIRDRQMQREAQLSLLQAAEIGNALIGLARNYDQLALQDVLHGLNDALTLAGRISPESQSLKRSMKRLQGATEAWENDPVLKPLLAQPITRNP
jgi:hypothetical protein